MTHTHAPKPSSTAILAIAPVKPRGLVRHHLSIIVLSANGNQCYPPRAFAASSGIGGGITSRLSDSLTHRITQTNGKHKLNNNKKHVEYT